LRSCSAWSLACFLLGELLQKDEKDEEASFCRELGNGFGLLLLVP
jgi:hypothetical protein